MNWEISVAAKVAPLLVLLCAWKTAQVSAQSPKIKVVREHVSPLVAELVWPGGETDRVMVVGTKSDMGPGGTCVTHQLPAIGAGDTRVLLWLDTIRAIRPLQNNQFLAVSKDGSQRRLTYQHIALLSRREDDGLERTDIRKLREVRFLHPPRKDRDGYAMFDHWRFSPFTGEKLATGPYAAYSSSSGAGPAR